MRIFKIRKPHYKYWQDFLYVLEIHTQPITNHKLFRNYICHMAVANDLFESKWIEPNRVRPVYNQCVQYIHQIQQKSIHYVNTYANVCPVRTMPNLCRYKYSKSKRNIWRTWASDLQCSLHLVDYTTKVSLCTNQVCTAQVSL